MKEYCVNIDMRWSKEFFVEARNKKEAKEKAWERFKKTLSKKYFNIEVDEY